MKKVDIKLIVAIFMIAMNVALSGCGGKSGMSGFWLTQEGGSVLKDVIGGIQFKEEVKGVVIVNKWDQVYFGDTNDNYKNFGLYFVAPNTVTFIAPSQPALVAFIPTMNYKVEGDRLIINYDENVVLSAKYTLKDNLTLIFDNGDKIVFRRNPDLKTATDL
jgi:hypothetical protein